MEIICNVMLKKLIDENNAKTAQVHLQVLLTTLHRMNITHSSTNSYRPPTRFSGWLTLCCGNLIFYQKKK